MADIDLIKELRELTGLSVAKIKQALDEAEGVRDKALKKLKELGGAMAAKKADRTLGAGIIEAYVHNGKIGAMIELSCETDFVARNDEFKALARDIAMHVSAMQPRTPQQALEQSFIKDESITVQHLIEQAVAKLGENIQLMRVQVMVLGQ